jgi:hypothetical protein
MSQRDKPPSTLKEMPRIAQEVTTKGWVGFIIWLDRKCRFITDTDSVYSRYASLFLR